MKRGHSPAPENKGVCRHEHGSEAADAMIH